jgi:hypothetical protein
MATKNILKGTFSVFTLLLFILMATVLIAVPFLLLHYYFSLEVAYIAYLMIGLVHLAYIMIRRRMAKSKTSS